MKYLLNVLVILIIVLLPCSSCSLDKDAYGAIRNAEPGDGQPLLTEYSKQLPKDEFQQLVRKLIKENMDLKSLGVAINYVVENKLCQFIPDIDFKCNQLSHFPVDSVWSVQLTETYTKEWMLNDLGWGRTKCDKLEELKKSCSGLNY